MQKNNKRLVCAIECLTELSNDRSRKRGRGSQLEKARYAITTRHLLR